MDNGRDHMAWGIAAEPSARVAWERENASFPVDLFRSWQECMTRPLEFFGRLDPDVPFARPLLFFLVFWILGSGLGTMSAEALLGDWLADYYTAQGMEAPGTMWKVFIFFLSPFVGMVALALYVGFTHAGVRVFVRDAGPIGVTGHGLCYVAAPQVVAVVPFIGWLVAAGWSLFLAVVAVQRLHSTSFGRATAAVLVPPIVFWFALTMLMVLLGVLLAIAIGGAAGAA